MTPQAGSKAAPSKSLHLSTRVLRTCNLSACLTIKPISHVCHVAHSGTAVFVHKHKHTPQALWGGSRHANHKRQGNHTHEIICCTAVPGTIVKAMSDRPCNPVCVWRGGSPARRCNLSVVVHLVLTVVTLGNRRLRQPIFSATCPCFYPGHCCPAARQITSCELV
jgi:hypothetical protein